MQEYVPINKVKPFRGIATIQLFDKDTGKLIEEHVHENTYNDRISYYTYLYSIMKSQCSAFSKTMPNYHSLEPDATDIISGASSIYLGKVEDSSNIRYFGNLVLTANTNAEDAHGYFNGVPVGVANATGYSVDTEKSCIGKCNCDESYFGNDRLHLVFDFETSKCNVSFDALWLFPTMGSSNGGSNVGSRVFYPQSRNRIMYTRGNDVITEKDTSNAYSTYYLNDEYACIYEHYSSSSSSYLYAIYVFNRYTGEVVTSYSSTKTFTVYAPFYYDAASKDLYYLYWPYTNDYIAGMNMNFKCFFNKSFAEAYQNTYFISKINLGTGTKTNVKKFSDIFNLSNNDYGYTTPIGSMMVCYGLNNAITFVLTVTDYAGYSSDSTGYVFFYSFDFSTMSLSLLNKHLIQNSTINACIDTGSTDNYGGTISGTSGTASSSLNIQNAALSNNMLYTLLVLDKTLPAENRYAVFDILTGKLINKQYIGNLNVRSAKQFIADGLVKYAIPIDDSFNTPGSSSNYAIAIHDFLENKKPQYVLIDASPVYRLGKYDYYTQIWSTHNKLTSEIKKTNMTTMKITYDIIWESFSEEIVPNLA